MDIRLPELQFASLKSAFTNPYYMSETGMKDALSSSGDFRRFHAIHMGEVFRLDLVLLDDGPFSNCGARSREIV